MRTLLVFKTRVPNTVTFSSFVSSVRTTPRLQRIEKVSMKPTPEANNYVSGQLGNHLHVNHANKYRFLAWLQ